MPVDLNILLAFILAGGAVVVSPGPDTILIIRYTMSSGARVGGTTVFGVQVGLAVHTLLAIFGISVIIASSPVLFQGVAVIGGGYLCWLGLQSFRSGGLNFSQGAGVPVGAWTAWRDAFLSNLFNPKVILLYLALMPGFVDLDKRRTGLQLAVLGSVLIAINILWQGGLVVTADRARRWLASDAVQRVINVSTGAILVAFGIGMILTNLEFEF